MKILLMTAMFPPIRTGSSYYAADLAEALARRNHDVAVVTVRNDEPDTESYPYPVYRLFALRWSFALKKLFKHLRISSFFPANYRTVYEIVDRHSPDVIILISHYHDIGFLAVAASKRYGIPLVCSINTQLQLLSPVIQAVMRFFDRLICGRMILSPCAAIISLDTEIERYLSETYPQKIAGKSRIIPYGIHGESDVLHRHEHDYGFHGQVIGIGAVIQQRNYLASITLFANLLKEYPALRFKIIGHIYYDEAVKLAARLGIAGKVIFTGELSRNAVLEEIRNSDLYLGIFSGEYVGLGSATVEAMMSGLPIISNAPPDLLGKPALVDMRDYIYADHRTMDVAVEKAVRVLRDARLRESIGRNGRAFVADTLNWDTLSEKVDALLRSICQANGLAAGCGGRM